MKRIIDIIRWIGVGIFGLMALSSLVQGGFVATLLFLLGGAIIAPLGVVSNIRSKLKLNKVISIILAVFLLFAGALATPNSDVPTNTDDKTQISGTVSQDKSNGNHNEKTTSTNSQTTSKSETSSDTTDSSKSEQTHKDESKITECSHTSTIVKNKLNATCLEDGYTGDTYCESCDKKVKNGSTISATGHDTEIRNKKNATESSEGYTGDTYCKLCNTKIKSGETIAKIVNNTQQETNAQTVYVTETGKKYHSRTSCSGLSRAKKIYSSTLQGAKNRGLDPCSICY